MARSDSIKELQDFADKLKSLYILPLRVVKWQRPRSLTLEHPTVLNSEDFIETIRTTLEGILSL